MRRSRSDAAETRERIVSTASKMFLNQGLGSVGMRDIMSAASLTQGGFYRHFESKEQLVAEANSTAFDRLLLMLETEIAGKPSAEAIGRIVSLYMGQSQGKDKPYLCPLSMLGAELSHGDTKLRAVALDGYRRLVQLLSERLTSLPKKDAHTMASSIVSTMVGAVTLANIASDKVTAKAILSNARHSIEAHLAHLVFLS